MKGIWLLIGIPVIVVVFFIVSWAIQVSWNNSIVAYLQLPYLTFNQACWLNTLSFLLFRNIPISSGK